MSKDKLKKLLIKVTYKQILAIMTLFIMFYVGTTTFPLTTANIADFLKGNTKHTDLIKKISDNYSNMLSFKGDYFKNKGYYINLNGLMARMMGQRWMNERVKLDNGNLSRLYEAADMTLSATQITKLYNAQLERGGDFLYVLAPTEIPKYENILPIGYNDYSNQNGDNLLEILQTNSVPVFDLREEMYKEGINHSDAFYKTDHHWKAETGFWAYTKIVEYLTQNKIMKPVDSQYTSAENFNFDVQKGVFLGSAGKRTGTYFTGIDDLTIITPKFETNMSFEITSTSFKKQGSFAEVALGDSIYKNDYFIHDPLSGYGNGYYNVKKIRNENAPVELSIMCIGHSFSNTSLTFLSLVADSVDLLDFQWEFKENFKEYYDRYNPDIIIMLTYASHASHVNNVFDFFSDLNK